MTSKFIPRKGVKKLKLVTDSTGTEKDIVSRKVAICIPCGDHMASGTAYDLARLMGFSIAMEPGLDISLIFQKSSVLPLSRAMLAEQAVAFNADYVLWIDSDMRFEKDALLRLLTICESAPDVSIVGANYPTRKEPVLPVSFEDVHGKIRHYTEADETSIHEVAACGFGFLLMRQEVISTMDKPWFQIGYSPESDDYQGEDVFFLLKARDNGFKAWIDPVVTRGVSHLGEYDYGNSDALAYRNAMKERESNG